MRLDTAFDVTNAEELVQFGLEGHFDADEPVRFLDAAWKLARHVRVVDLPIQANKADAALVLWNTQQLSKLVAARPTMPRYLLRIQRDSERRFRAANFNWLLVQELCSEVIELLLVRLGAAIVLIVVAAISKVSRQRSVSPRAFHEE